MARNKALVAALTVVVFAACGDGSGGHAAHDGEAGASDGTIPGRPAASSEADREIEVVATDDLSFDPEEIGLSRGDVVTFAVRNAGETEHEFVLGDEAYQASHGEAMGDGHMMDMSNGVVVEPGETRKLTWRFSSLGEILYGCHEPGHYDGGMVGTIRVS